MARNLATRFLNRLFRRKAVRPYLIGAAIILFLSMALFSGDDPEEMLAQIGQPSSGISASPTQIPELTQTTSLQPTLPEDDSKATGSAPIVARIVDGDTVELADGQKVRYIGIDTPERGDCYFAEASEYNRQLVLDKPVRIEQDISETDRFGRVLGYVYQGDLFVNEELVRQGFAQAATYPPDVAFQNLFAAAEQEAREQERGIWAPDACHDENE